MSNFRNGRSVLNLSVAVLAATLVSLGDGSEAMAGGGGPPPTYFFGLPHNALGGATLALDPTGRLVVSNIGSSGQDGVSVELGGTIGYVMPCDFGLSGAMATGSHGKWKTFRGGGLVLHETALTFAESSGGQCDVLLDYTGEAATCVDVELRLGGALVASSRSVVPPNSPPELMVSGNIGSHDAGGGLPPEPPELSCETSSTNVRLAFRPTAAVSWSVALPGTAPVACDQVSITLHGLPPGQPVLTQCDVTGSGLPNGEMAVTGGEIKIKHKGWDGLIYHRAAAVGAAHITGVAGPDICAGCPECCEPSNGDPLAFASGVTITNIGSSGQDGIEVTSDSLTATEMEMQFSPLDFSNPAAAMDLRATGSFSDGNTHEVTCSVSSGAIPGSLSVAADFSSFASVEALAAVLNGNTVIGSVVVPNPVPGTPLVSITDLDGLGVQLVRCGTLQGDAVTGQPGYALYFGSEELMVVGGQAFIGDRLHVRASDCTLHATSMKTKVCQGKHFRSVTLTCRSITPSSSPEPQEVTFGGLVHSTVGAATMVMRDSDGDGITDLQLHNIGSSGQDGVSIDLRQSQGGAHTFCGNGVPASNFTQIRFEGLDDECTSCAGDDLASVTLTPTGPSSMLMAAGGKGCCRGHVIIMKRGGSALAGGGAGPLYTFEFPFVDDEPWPISCDAGSTLRLRYHNWRWVSRPSGSPALAGGVGDDELQMRLGLAQESGGGALSGVTVTHPLHGTFTNVEEIVVSRCIDSDAGMVDRGRMLVTAAPGCTDCTVALASSAMFLHMHQHGTMGQARLVSEDCDDADPDFSPTMWVANIGSSGQDGVEIRLPAVQRDRACDETNPLPNVIGGGVHIRESPTRLSSRSFSLHGSLAGFDDATATLDSIALLPSPVPGGALCVCTADWAGMQARVTGTVRDQFGNVVLAVADLPPGPVCDLTSGDEPGNYSGSFNVTVSGTLAGAGGPPHSVESSTQKLEWPSDVIFVFGGQAPVVGRSLELHVLPPVGAVVQGDFRLNAMRLGGSAPFGTTRALGITEESVVRMPPTPPCPADIVPYGTNGDGQVNVTDLLAVIGGWGTCASCPATVCVADVTHDCQVNVTDLLAVIGQWGACP